jgi:hypothetical protein
VTSVSELESKLNSNDYIGAKSLASSNDAVTIARVLRNWLVKLTNGVIPNKYYEEVVLLGTNPLEKLPDTLKDVVVETDGEEEDDEDKDIVESFDEKSLQCRQWALNKLPTINLLLLKYLIRFFRSFLRPSVREKNNYTIDSLTEEIVDFVITKVVCGARCCFCLSLIVLKYLLLLLFLFLLTLW